MRARRPHEAIVSDERWSDFPIDQQGGFPIGKTIRLPVRARLRHQIATRCRYGPAFAINHG